jgi:hypothetical protein
MNAAARPQDAQASLTRRAACGLVRWAASILGNRCVRGFFAVSARASEPGLISLSYQIGAKKGGIPAGTTLIWVAEVFAVHCSYKH